MKQNFSACIFNNKYIYTIGGFYKGKLLNFIDRYDIGTNIWSSVALTNVIELTERGGAFSYQINPMKILIAGGEGKGGVSK